nr:fimbria/pilus outer membrane usher protein [Acinetobacter tandoii]
MNKFVYRCALCRALLCTSSLHAQVTLANEMLQPSTDVVDQQELYLSVVLNQASSPVYGHFIQTSQDLLISRETLQELQLSIHAADALGYTGFVALSQIKGLSYQYNSAEQHIELTVPVEVLKARTTFGYEQIPPAKVNPAQIKPGLLFNYDLYSQATEDVWSLSGWNELRLFGIGTGNTFSISANHAYTKTKTTNELSSQILDTYWQKDFADQAITLTVGDSQSRALEWTRSTRISGIKIAKNFSLQPYQVTSPLESFKGSVLVPSTVDLLINGIQQSTSDVLPGQFDIQASPSITGAGNAQLLITDLNGQQRIVNFSLFGTSQLLQKGLTDWEINLGVHKLDYAVKSFSYSDDPVVNATLRHGLSNNTTLESHTEYSRDVALAGFGIIHRLPNTWGLINGAYSYSDLNQNLGQSYAVGYEWNNPYVNFSLQHQKSDDDFGDLASALGYGYIKQSDHVFLGVNTDYGQFGGSYVAQKNQNSENEYLVFNWSYYFPSKKYLTLNMTRNLNEKEDTFFLSLNIPLDRQVNATLNAQQDADRNKFSANIRKTAIQNEDDWGWQTNLEFSDNNNYSVQGQIQRETQTGEWDVGLQSAKINSEDYTTVVGSTRGSLVMMEKSVFPMRQSLNSFAVVSTEGVSDIPVRLENRVVGKTNRKGLMLIDTLNPYQHNDISIDTLDLPLEYKIETTRIDAVPYNASGVVIQFPIYKMRAIQLSVTDPQGIPMKMGSRVWVQDTLPNLESTEHTIVGRDGMIYLENPSSQQLYVEQDGQVCNVVLPDFSQQYGFLDMGSVQCQ